MSFKIDGFSMFYRFILAHSRCRITYIAYKKIKKE